LFSDLSGYTAMNEKLDPEEVEGIMSRIKAEAVKIVESHGGIVSQFVGDEVLALFGIPTAHEDDPRRAVRAALELHELTHAMSPEVEEKIGRPLSMHTGIDTGLVVTSSRDVRDGTVGVTGDTINTGARLKASARDDQILVSPDTQRRIAPFFELEVLPPADMKGKADTMTPYRVVGETAVKTRFEASERRGLSRYVGRERELEVLRECLQQAEQGQGQVVSVVGEAGLGKTRLVYEFRTALDLTRVNQVRGRCAAKGASLSYLPFVDLFQRWFRIRETDSPDQVLEKAERSAQALAEGLEEHLPAILHLLSIPSERQFPPSMAGQAIRRKIEAALKAFLAAGCQERPLVMIFEDLHWVDENSEAMLQQYIESISTLPVMLLLNYRPEYRPPWGHYSHLTPLALKPLSEKNTGAIVASALKVDDLPEGLAPVVHARAEGNPFFIEELALSLEEEGVVERKNGSAVLTRPVEAISFPDTVQAVVRARVDRLPEGSRDTLRLASVVGREFTESLVSRLSESADPVTERLGELKSLEMILEKRFQPELEFMFKHAITHQVAYDSLLLSRRKTLHKLVGMGIEELYADRLPEFYEMLAHHFEQGEVWDKAVEFHIQAGIKAVRNFSIETALAGFAKAQAILSEHRPEVPAALEFQLCISQAETLQDVVRWADRLLALERACVIAEQLGELPLLVQAKLALAHTQLYTDDFFKAVDTVNALEPITINVPDLHASVLAEKWWIGTVVGDMAAWKARNDLERLIPSAISSSMLPSAQIHRGLGHRFSGESHAAIQILEKLVPASRQVAATGRYLGALFQYALALGEAGRLQEAIELLQEGRATGLEVGELNSTPKVVNSLGWAFHELCIYEKALEFNTQALEMVGTVAFEELTHRMEVVTMTKVNIAENHQMKGGLGEARRLLQSLYDETEPMEFIWNRARWKIRLLMVWAEIELAEDDLAAAQARLNEANSIEILNQAPYLKYQIRGGRLQGNIHAANGKYDDAEAELDQTLERAQHFGNPTQLWRTQQALGNLYARMDREADALDQYRAARDVVQGVADGLTDPELKEGFLNAGPIREVFAQAEGA
jgi:class 3 adenylate cyclase/tetratricopeptide (TPR) repeat protein